MKIDQLTYFLETAKQEHIGKASKILAISPSAISHSISSLEEELGRKFFEKKGKHIYLTSHGKMLMERAEGLINQVNAIKEDIASDKVELTGNFRLAATHVLCSELLAPAWNKISNKNSKTTSEIYTLRSADVVSGVLQGDYDIGLCFSPQDHPELDSLTIYRGQLRLVVHKKHPILNTKKQKQIKELSQYRAVLPKAFQGIEVCTTHPMFAKFSIEPKIDCSFDSYEIGIHRVLNSHSWGLLPDYLFKNNNKLTEIVHPKAWNAPYTISVLWRKGRFVPKILRILLEKLESSI